MSSTTTRASRSNTTSHGRAANRIRRARRRPVAPGRAQRRRSAAHDRRMLGSYCDWNGRPREIVALSGAGDSVLVLDRDATTLGDRRLLAHLAADEPPENAAVVSRCFMRQARRGRCSCRLLDDADLRAIPFADDLEAEQPSELTAEETLHDVSGRCYRIERLASEMSIPELRWCQGGPKARDCERETLSVREVIACLEHYGPVLALTSSVVSAHRGSDEVSVAVLRAELVRMQESPIVLNRALRAAVVDAVERHGQSMSEIAMRCGRIKHDSAGNASGETSWLARRLGLLPEGGRHRPTPWIHSEVLALIAREGLGLSPREVEAD
jgi:hypothetical protein